MSNQEEKNNLLDTFSQHIFLDEDLFSSEELLRQRAIQEEWLKKQKFRNKLNKAKRMKSKKKRKAYRKYLYGI